jgi:hypothetical protein
MNRKKVLTSAVVIILTLIATAFAGLYFGENSPIGEYSPTPSTRLPPFDYSIGVYPVNGTVRQGNNISTNINITYMQGAAQNVTLTASGPEGVSFSFSNQTGTPTLTDVFSSNLTIIVPNWVPTGVYQINVTSFTDKGEISTYFYPLTVLDVEIQVSGIMAVTSNNYSWPGQLQFISGDSTYKANLHFEMVVPYKYPTQEATYSVYLPNHQNYSVVCILNWYRADMPGPMPNPAYLQSKRVYWGALSVDCNPGNTSITQDINV